MTGSFELGVLSLAFLLVDLCLVAAVKLETFVADPNLFEADGPGLLVFYN
jgi:hypothetical protein